MKTIYKHCIEPGGTTLMIRGHVLSAGVQGDDVMVWATHDDRALERKVRVQVMGTGHPFVDAPESDFVGTVFMGPFVWHVFVSEGMLKCGSKDCQTSRRTCSSGIVAWGRRTSLPSSRGMSLPLSSLLRRTPMPDLQECVCGHPRHQHVRSGNPWHPGESCAWCETCKGRHDGRRCMGAPCRCSEYIGNPHGRHNISPRLPNMKGVCVT